MDSRFIEAEFLKIFDSINTTKFIEIEENLYFDDSFEFKFKNKNYIISYSFETENAYCSFLDFQKNRNNQSKAVILDIQHNLIDGNNFDYIYECKNDSENRLYYYYDHIFKFDNQCYIYKKISLYEHYRNKLNTKDLKILKEYENQNPDYIFLVPEKILYSGYLSNKCEKLSNEISNTKIKLNEGKDFSYQTLTSRGDTAETDILMYTPGAYYIEYPYFDFNLNPITTCAYDDLNQIVNSNVSSYTDSYEEIYLKVDFSVEFFENINSIEIIKFTLHNYLEVYYGQRFGKPDVYEFDIIYIFDQDCNIISTPDAPMKLFYTTEATHLTILSGFVISSLDEWGYVILELDLLNNVWQPYELKNDEIIFDLTDFQFNYSDNTNFTCNNIIYGYDREWIFHWPTSNWFAPETFSIPIYEISKIANLNLSVDNIISCYEYSSK